MKRNYTCHVISSVLILVGFVGAAFGQGTTSRLTGTVQDPSGAAVPGAVVTLTNEGTQTSLTAETTDAGVYSFESIQVGQYTVAVEKSGFKQFVSTGNTANINQPATVNVTLEVGGVNESVRVESTAEIVQTSSSGNFGNTVEQRTLVQLPIVGSRGRNPLNFILFQPGVTPDANTGGGVHVHGARDRAFNFTLDGIDINDSTAGGSNFTPIRTNPDSLTEFQVVTGNFTAELGRSSGAQVTLVTRSGTNNFHGTLFEFYQTPRFHANEYENTINTILVNGERRAASKPQFVQHIFGGSIGGPLFLPRFGEGGKSYSSGRNKTFFFANLQELRTSQSFLVNRTVYTAQARAGQFRYVVGGANGNASSSTPSVDLNGNPVPGRNIGTFNIVGNPNIPLGLDPTTQGLIGLTPLPNNFRLGDGLNTAGFTFVAPQTERQYDFTTKIDHNFNERNSVYVRYSRGSQNTLGDRVNGGLQAFPNLPNAVDTFRTPRNLAVNYRATLTPTLVNELVVGFNRFAFSFNNPDPNASTNSPVQLNLVTSPLNSSPTINNARRITTYQVVDNISYLRGANTFKFGTNLRYQKHIDDRSSVAGVNTREQVFLGTGTNPVPGSFGTSNISGINSSDRSRLDNAINDLLGRVGTINQGFVAVGNTFGPAGTRFNYDARYPEYDFYGQDSWKVRSNLTLDLGLRYEVRLSPRAPNNIILRPDRPVRVGEPPSNTIRFEEGKLYNDSYRQFAPSVGMAWDPFKSGKTSIRANYRLAYDRTNTFVFSSFIFQSAPGLTRAVTNDAFGRGGGLLRDGLPILNSNDVTPQQFRQPAAFSTNTLTVVDPAVKYPRTDQYGASFQREVGFKSVIEVNYIGRRGKRLFGGYDANQVDITSNGFVRDFEELRTTGNSARINALLAGFSSLRTGETGSQFLLRQSLAGSVTAANGTVTSNLVTGGGVSSAAAIIATARDSAGVPVLARNGFSPFFFQAYPQFTGAVNVLDSNDRSRYNALEVQLSRRITSGFGFQVSYTLAKSEDTRSFDPTFAIANRGSLQSSANTPFDIRNRNLNYARSDFDRRHALQGYTVIELPFGRGHRYANDLNPVLDRIIGGFEFATIVRLYSGRPFTVYSGVNTLTNVVQTPANCNSCSPNLGRITVENGQNVFFTADQRAQFSAPAPGEFSNTGRNFFTGPSLFNMDVTLSKRIRFTESRNFELRLEAQNATNTPSFDFPNANLASTSFGIVGGGVVSSSRKVQLSGKFNF
ncbi:MAG: carboxypeptidase regulatory-like domain-containing protein [Pyrinomonadaceae bacterium]